MNDVLCHSCENENKLVEICFTYNYIFPINRGGGGVNREGVNREEGGLINIFT